MELINDFEFFQINHHDWEFNYFLDCESLRFIACALEVDHEKIVELEIVRALAAHLASILYLELVVLFVAGNAMCAIRIAAAAVLDAKHWHVWHHEHWEDVLVHFSLEKVSCFDWVVLCLASLGWFTSFEGDCGWLTNNMS